MWKERLTRGLTTVGSPYYIGHVYKSFRVLLEHVNNEILMGDVCRYVEENGESTIKIKSQERSLRNHLSMHDPNGDVDHCSTVSMVVYRLVPEKRKERLKNK